MELEASHHCLHLTLRGDLVIDPKWCDVGGTGLWGGIGYFCQYSTA